MFVDLSYQKKNKMEFKGTKGRWTLNWNGSSCFQNMLQIVNEYNQEVCNFGDNTVYYPTEGAEPNQYDALLISKAPEMLEMLIVINDFIKENENINYKVRMLSREVPNLEQLIKEATKL